MMKAVPEYEIRSLMEQRHARDIRDVGIVALGVIMIWLTQGHLPAVDGLLRQVLPASWYAQVAMHHHLPAWAALLLLAAVAPLVEFERSMILFAGIAIGQFVPAREPWLATAWLARELPTVGVTIWCLSGLIHRGLWWWAHRRRALAMDTPRRCLLAARDAVIGLGLVVGAFSLLPECFAGPSQVAHAAGLGWQIGAICVFTLVTAKAEMDRAYATDIQPPLLEHMGLSVTTRTEEVIGRALSAISADAVMWLTAEAKEARPAQQGESKPKAQRDAMNANQAQQEQPKPKEQRNALERLKAWLFAEDEDEEADRPKEPRSSWPEPRSTAERVIVWLFGYD